VKVLIGSDALPRRRFTARLLWEPRDIWLGVFWNRVDDQVILHASETGKSPEYPTYLLVYICLVPCVPFCVAWRTA
jgi:hypothetical protein